MCHFIYENFKKIWLKFDYLKLRHLKLHEILNVVYYKKIINVTI
jgi:hypothetical protein